MRAAAFLLAAALAACGVPPPAAYVGGSARSDAGGVGLGTDAAGESCTQQPRSGGADIFCGTWDQPSGHITVAPARGQELAALATSSGWRNGLNERLACGDPASTQIADRIPALLLSCTRKVGGWPQAAIVARIGDADYLADGILPALSVLQRGIAVLSGQASPSAAAALPPGQADALLASRLAAQSFSAGDIGQYQALMVAGTRANLAENYTGAERAYRAAYALQQKALGPNDPNTAIPLMLIALQLSNQGRTVDASTDFERATRLVGTATDPFAKARLEHYRGLNAINDNKPNEALPLLQQAERDYEAVLSPDPAHRPAAPGRATACHQPPL